jgi:hypothetical protein
VIDQQVNLYQPEFRPETNAFQSIFMLKSIAILAVALVLIYAFAQQGVSGVQAELEIVAKQEATALERLQNVRPLIQAVTGELSWSEQLADASRMLAERQAMLSLIQGASLGDTEGFSRHLAALARQDIEGVWITRVVLSALGDKTRIDGRTIRAELVPLYVQNLTDEPAFTQQRFHRFEIDNPVDESETSLTFSMNSQVLVASREQSR